MFPPSLKSFNRVVMDVPPESARARSGQMAFPFSFTPIYHHGRIFQKLCRPGKQSFVMSYTSVQEGQKAGCVSHTSAIHS